MAAAATAPSAGNNQFGLDAELFTRGATVDKDRGESMVQKHMEKMQQERENQALQDIGKLMPQVGLAVRVMALKETAFNVELAIGLLRGFEQEKGDELNKLRKKRRKVETAQEDAVKRAEQDQADEDKKAKEASRSSDSGSSSSSGSDSSSDDSGSDSDSGRDRKKRKRSSSSKKKRSKDKRRSSSKRKDKDRKRSKKRSKDSDGKARAKGSGGPTNTENFGRFGLLRESDMHTKHAEFTLWAIDVKKTNPEHLGRLEEKELFKDYMEDFNTGTLPHRKYYNLDIYQREKAAKAAKKGQKDPNKKSLALADEEQLRRQREEERIKVAEERRRRDLAELQLTGKAKDMREQELLRLQMQAAYKTGDRAKAAVLQKQLMTDEEKMAKGIMKWKPKI